MSDKLRELKREMIQVYGMSCWLWGIDDRKLTGHHIVPLRQNGPTIWRNIALLNRQAHDEFNYIEQINRKAATEINGLFTELNKTYSPPTDDYYEELNGIYVKRLIYVPTKDRRREL